MRALAPTVAQAKQALTNVDVAAVAAELDRLLAGGRFDKAYQPAKDEVLLRFRARGAGRVDVLFALGRFVTAVRRPPENPSKPSMVAQILRTAFANGRVQAVRQVGFDRVLRIDVERADGVHALVLEVFGDGNLLVLDPAGTIVLPMRGEEFAHRRLRKGEPYVPPPSGPHPLRLDRAALEQAGAAAQKDLVRFLALDLGFGPVWGEELCLRAGIDKRTLPGNLGPAGWDALHATLQGLAADLRRNDLAPGLVHEDGQAVDAVPFPLLRYPAPRFAFEEAPTFREALDAFFVGEGATGDEEEPEDPRRPLFEEARARIQRQVDQMEQAIAGFVAEEEARKQDADALYATFQQVEGILGTLQKARATRSWDEVATVLVQARERGDAAAQAVRDLRGHEGLAVLRVRTVEGEPRDVEVDLRANVQGNADRHYEAAKKARSRREGAAKALAEARARMAELEARGLDGFGAAPKRVEATKRHFWFETYRWTPTPSGLVAVGGRNAGQNDAVVKKYLRDGDRYVHAEIHGAPSVVVRPVEGAPVEVPEADLRAACQFASCASRAWRQFGEASAYWVTPQQVSKTPRSGEFVPRGAWIVHGRRNVVAGLPMQWAVGPVRFDPSGQPVPRGQAADRHVAKLAGGPPACIEPFADAFVRLEPGERDPNEVAAELAERFGFSIEEAQAAMPPGPVQVRG